MIAVIQRVSSASLVVEDDNYHVAIERGLLVLLGVMQGDGPFDAQWMAGKIARVRIFPDLAGKMNHSVEEVRGEILLVSQFTLAGDCEKGNRPSFASAADPETGMRLYEDVAGALSRFKLPVKTGVFGAMMRVSLVNEGPVTIILRSPEKKAAHA